MERLTFNTASSRRGGGPVVAGRYSGRHDATAAPVASAAGVHKPAVRERYDWDYLWMVAFTALLFFRPQDQFPPAEALHLAELTAIAGLAAMAVRRLRLGQPIAKVNAEVVGVIALGGVILATLPFSTWPGGSLHVFSDIYVKIILIFALMVATVTSAKRVRQMTWLMVLASSYIASRAVFDYLRGVNLTEGDRVRGAIGGMFNNPNDLALNLVTFLAPALIFVVLERRASRRLLASACALVMLAAIVCTKSRSGFLGLIAMGVVVLYYTARLKPGIILAVVVAGIIAVPAMPQSFWDRMDSITNAEADPTGSREARLRLLAQGFEVFTENPLTGVGAGQFQNYNEPGVTIERWRVTHNVWLQVAAELGIAGLLAFAFLVIRAYRACFTTLRSLRHRKGRARAPATTLDAADQQILVLNAKSMLAALVGWTVCSLFAAVAFNWTFYYVLALAVCGRDIVQQHRAAPEPAVERAPSRLFVRVHA
jgi:putative inorganic carbon (hco3(-)) transporter